MEDLFSDGKNEKVNREGSKMLNKIKLVILGPEYELAMNIVTVLNVLTVLIGALIRSTSE